MNNKKQRQEFVKKAETMIMEVGGKYMDKAFNTKMFMLMGDDNYIIFKLEPESEHKHVYSIFGKFEKPCKLSANCKYNFHGYYPNVEPYLNEILKELDLVPEVETNK